jgi:uncharacterized protein (DUF2267 family)
MTDSTDMQLTGFYEHVFQMGNLRSMDHARRWTNGVLETLGTVLDRKSKRAVSKNLPEELASSLNGVFWLLHFRDPMYSSDEFCRRVAKRSGNSDGEFARVPTQAVFGGLRLYIGPDLDQRVADSLSPEVSLMWQEARPD